CILKSALKVQRTPGDRRPGTTTDITVERTPLYEAFGISPYNPKMGRYRICMPAEFRAEVRGKNLIKKNIESKGIPQGAPISAFLSNLYMLEFDKFVKLITARVKGWYIRYCDDILIVVPPYCADRIEKRVLKKIKELRLEINSKKTERSRFSTIGNSLVADKSLQYLGFTFDGQRILIRSAALARYSQRMKGAVRRAKATAKSRNTAKVSKGLPTKPLYKKSLLEKYSHVGRRNFITYGLRAAQTLESKSIKRQLRPLWKRLQDEIAK
ncbi:reverse transcriptase domain-containing protein, partial [Variovorax sp. Varisp62]|uniref:reverse transcriptase domain-containing protein n=1 Tax=Variovorax sp. Varisp62 TaxID=3243049 RepID=UPI0039B56B57